MRRVLPILVTLAAWLGVAGAAQAVVVDMNAVGQASVAYNAADQSGYYGVALVPGSGATLTAAGIPAVTSSASCSDPWLTSDLTLPSTGLCWHAGGTVMHANETFALTWDPMRSYWSTTRNYVEQYLRDVADGSGTLTSPYALTSQYSDPTGLAANSSAYGGGCIDYGSVGGAACQFGSTNASGAGHDYPANGCTVTGTNQFSEDLSGAWGQTPNAICLTDAQIQGEVSTMVTQTGMLARAKPGYTPTVVMLTPPGVEVCLDAAGKLCSANGGSSARFCSYHAQVNVGGTEVAYVVQPWTAGWHIKTGCDEPDAAAIPDNPSAITLATDVGIRLVSPLSQAHIAAIVDPALNGWFANNGSEINDNGCIPYGNGLDTVTVGKSSQNPYLLQREFNNAGVIESDPNALSCSPSVGLVPTFVVPSAVNKGDVVQLDGSTTISTLMVPKADYLWSFGDGTTAVGPSVVHTYTSAGSYTVKLTVIDRGGNVAAFSQSISVLGAQGQVVAPPPAHSNPGLQARLQLMPQGLRAMLRSGMAIRVTANQAADGIATLSISRAAAKRAHISLGHGTAVVIGRGTVSGLKSGSVNLYLRVSRAMAKKLAPLGHVTLTVRLMLVAAGRNHLAIDAAAHY